MTDDIPPVDKPKKPKRPVDKSTPVDSSGVVDKPPVGKKPVKSGGPPLMKEPVVVFSMATLRAEHPEMTEEQVRAEFNRLLEEAQTMGMRHRAQEKLTRGKPRTPRPAKTAITPEPPPAPPVHGPVHKHGRKQQAAAKRGDVSKIKISPCKIKTNPETGLTDQMERFAREYLVDFNAKRAAIVAGYSEKTAAQQASRLLTSVVMQAYLAKLQEPILKKLEVTQERIMEEVARVAFSNIMDFVTVDSSGQAFIDLQKCTREQAAALSQIEVIEMPPTTEYSDDADGATDRQVLKVKIKTWDKMSALEKLMKRHGLLKEHIEVSGKIEMTDTELARRMAFMLRSAAQRRT